MTYGCTDAEELCVGSERESDIGAEGLAAAAGIRTGVLPLAGAGGVLSP